MKHLTIDETAALNEHAAWREWAGGLELQSGQFYWSTVSSCEVMLNGTMITVGEDMLKKSRTEGRIVLLADESDLLGFLLSVGCELQITHTPRQCNVMFRRPTAPPTSEWVCNQTGACSFREKSDGLMLAALYDCTCLVLERMEADHASE